MSIRLSGNAPPLPAPTLPVLYRDERPRGGWIKKGDRCAECRGNLIEAAEAIACMMCGRETHEIQDVRRATGPGPESRTPRGRPPDPEKQPAPCVGNCGRLVARSNDSGRCRACGQRGVPKPTLPATECREGCGRFVVVAAHGRCRACQQRQSRRVAAAKRPVPARPPCEVCGRETLVGRSIRFCADHRRAYETRQRAIREGRIHAPELRQEAAP